MSVKTTLTEHHPLLRPVSSYKSRHHGLVALLVGLLVILCVWVKYQFDLVEIPPLLSHAKPWSWTDVRPSRDLRWRSCYNGTLDCARLDVPMDWLEPSDSKRVILGVVRLAARVKDVSLPPVFINPGGPGGSGIDFLRKNGRELQIIVGDNHDLIGFDPRGVGVSTPRIECWGTVQARHSWEMQDTPVVDERPGLAYDAYARALALSGSCEAALNSSGILEHISTVNHARDMLEILLRTGHSKLRYWGFSYGTMLGGVFAALFPEKVERLVCDGNVNYKGWFDIDIAVSVADADLIFDAFDTSCYNAGANRCALWDQTPEAIRGRRDKVHQLLKKKPVIIPAYETGSEMPELVTYSKLQHLTRAIAYKPLHRFEDMARVYAALEIGNGTPYFEMARTSLGGGEDGFNICELAGTPANMPRESSSEPDAFSAVMCTDARPLDDTPDEFAAYAERILNVSKWTGAASAPFRACCIGRRVRPKWKFSDEDLRGHTAHPILFIGNTADNVTPLQNAHDNAKRFPGSRVLTQVSYGHSSLAAPSSCTARHIRTYFQNGTVPLPGTICDPDVGLFGLGLDEAVQQEDELPAVMRKLSRDFDAGRFLQF